MAADKNRETLIQELLFVLFQRKEIVILTAAIIFLGFFAAALILPPVYRADGTLLVKAKEFERDPTSIEQSGLQVREIRKEDLYSEAQILASAPVARNAAARLIEDNKVTLPPQDPLMPLTREQQADALGQSILGSLQTEVMATSNVLQVSLRWGNAREAEVILDGMMSEYLDQRLRVFNPAQKHGFLAEQVDTYLQGWTEEQNRMLAAVEAAKAPDPTGEIANNLILRREQQAVLGQLETSRIDIERQIAVLEGLLVGDGIHLFSFMQNAAVDALSAKIQQALLAKAEISKVFLETAEPVRTAERHVREVYQMMKDEIASHVHNYRNQLRVLDEKIRLVNDRLAELDRRNIELKRLELDLQRIQRTSQLKAFSFETFYKRRDEAALQGADTQGLLSKVVVLQPARALPRPVEPKRTLMVLFGAAIGVAAGLSMALLLNQFDTRISRPAHITGGLGFPMLFSIPDYGQQRGRAWRWPTLRLPRIPRRAKKAAVWAVVGLTSVMALGNLYDRAGPELRRAGEAWLAQRQVELPPEPVAVAGPSWSVTSQATAAPPPEPAPATAAPDPAPPATIDPLAGFDAETRDRLLGGLAWLRGLPEEAIAVELAALSAAAGREALAALPAGRGQLLACGRHVGVFAGAYDDLAQFEKAVAALPSALAVTARPRWVADIRRDCVGG